MLFTDVLTRLGQAFAAPLPGLPAQLLMAPRPRLEFPVGLDPSLVRHAAGLLLVYPSGGAAHVVLTERAHTLERHRGQISLPGGVIEPGETHAQAAIREAHEEIGIDPSHVRTLGALTSLDIPVSGFRLHPIVAATDLAPEFRHASDEVARVLSLDLDLLFAPGHIVWRTLQRERLTVDFPAFAVDRAEIWGATAMVLSEFLTLFGWTGPTTQPRLRPPE